MQKRSGLTWLEPRPSGPSYLLIVAEAVTGPHLESESRLGTGSGCCSVAIEGFLVILAGVCGLLELTNRLLHLLELLFQLFKLQLMAALQAVQR